MTIEKLEEELKNRKLNNIYLLYGEEKFLLESCLKKIKKNFGEIASGINYILIDENSIDTLISELNTPAFGYEKKLVIVKYPKLFKKELKRKKNSSDSIQDKLIEYIKSSSKENILVIIEEDIEKNLLYKEIEKNKGIICDFEFQKPAQIIQRLKAICNAYKVKIDNTTLNHLIEISGINMQNLINEIRKLIEYAGEEGTIKNEDIDNMSIRTIDSNIFDLTDNLGKKNIANAISILEELLYNKEPIQKILITMYNHIKKIYIVKISEKEDRNIIETLNLKPNQTFLINKYKIQSKYFSIEELKRILKALIDLDYNYKIGNIDLNVGLESILCTYFS